VRDETGSGPVTDTSSSFETMEDATEKPAKKARFKRFGKYSFWVWVGYQSVKGILTTTFIWIPLIYLHFFS